MAMYRFTPSDISTFTFQPTLDGSVYNVVLTWSLFGQRYYVNCYTTNNTLVFSLPLIGSLGSIHSQSMLWENGQVIVECEIPHNFKIGDTVNVSVINTLPTEYNGNFLGTVVGPTTFTYPLATNPGSVVSMGDVQYNINLAAGYFDSSLVYRTTNQTFEVTP